MKGKNKKIESKPSGELREEMKETWKKIERGEKVSQRKFRISIKRTLPILNLIIMPTGLLVKKDRKRLRKSFMTG